jgi:hypothetical protein
MSNPVKPTQVGPNRTGIATSPIDSKATIEGARAATDKRDPEGMALQHVRREYAEGAPPVGTTPPPASLKGVARVAIEKLKGNQPTVFLDLLGERLAYERTGTRLYDALLVKLHAAEPHPGGPTRAEVEQIRDEELQHLLIVVEAIESMGGDPTAITPSADVIGVAGSGWVAALTDPRTTLNEALKVMLAAELVDNDAWLALVDLAEGLGQDELAADFRRALSQEEDHLVRVRGWVTAAINGEAGIDMGPAGVHGDGPDASPP